jgi:AmiR/NasT family two-component response regulator
MDKQDAIRVLVADDSIGMRNVLQRLLSLMGYVVVGAAENGKRALEAVLELRPDIVLTDIEMPDMDGIEAARLIQERCPTPVVVLTAHQQPGLVEQASAAGVGAYLVKPPTEEELQRAITIAIARHNDLIELSRLNAALAQALENVKTLRGLLPICAACKRIRNDKGYWQQVEEYVREHSDADFTHSICPECAHELYPEYYADE